MGLIASNQVMNICNYTIALKAVWTDLNIQLIYCFKRFHNESSFKSPAI